MSLRKLVKFMISKTPVRVQSLIHAARFGGTLNIPVNSFVHPSVHIIGKNNIRIGSNSCISEGCWLNVNHREDNKISIDIGNNCFIGKQNFFTSGDTISVGDYTLTTLGCKFIGSGHVIEKPDKPYILTGTTDKDQIRIGVNCFIGVGVSVLGNVTIGHGSTIGSESLVLKDIPPFSIAIGNPARVVKRYSFTQKAWIPVSEINQEDENKMPTEQEYLAKLKADFLYLDLPWVASGRDMGNL